MEADRLAYTIRIVTTARTGIENNNNSRWFEMWDFFRGWALVAYVWTTGSDHILRCVELSLLKCKGLWNISRRKHLRTTIGVY